MPIEFERKFVLWESAAVEKKISKIAERAIKIKQKYLFVDKGLSVRLRSSLEDEVYTYRMTVKKDIGDERVVEIETIISEDDFSKLWLTATGKISKIRYLYQGWEIDFFKSKNENYLAIAEIELPENKKSPDFIPEIVSDYLVFEVPIGDKRFSNKKVGDVKYAAELLEEVKKKNKILCERLRFFNK